MQIGQTSRMVIGKNIKDIYLQCDSIHSIGCDILTKILTGMLWNINLTGYFCAVLFCFISAIDN